MEVAKAMQRVQLPTKYPEIFGCVSDKVDQNPVEQIPKSGLGRAWKFANKDGTTAQQFVGANADSVYL
eukprot:3323160-Amphidinium_carterae.1